MKVLTGRAIDDTRALLLLLVWQRGSTPRGPARYCSLILVEAKRGEPILPREGGSRRIWSSRPFPARHRRRMLDEIARAVEIARSCGVPLDAAEATRRAADPRADTPQRLDGWLVRRLWPEADDGAR